MQILKAICLKNRSWVWKFTAVENLLDCIGTIPFAYFNQSTSTNSEKLYNAELSKHSNKLHILKSTKYFVIHLNEEEKNYTNAWVREYSIDCDVCCNNTPNCCNNIRLVYKSKLGCTHFASIAFDCDKIK